MTTQIAMFAADTLGMPLYQLGEKLTGKQVREISFGDFEVPLKITATSDIMTGREASFWVTVGKLRLYMLVQESKSFLLVLDADVLKTIDTTAEVSLMTRLASLKNAVKSSLQWKANGDGRWTPVNLK